MNRSIACRLGKSLYLQDALTARLGSREREDETRECDPGRIMMEAATRRESGLTYTLFVGPAGPDQRVTMASSGSQRSAGDLQLRNHKFSIMDGRARCQIRVYTKNEPGAVLNHARAAQGTGLAQ